MTFKPVILHRYYSINISLRQLSHLREAVLLPYLGGGRGKAFAFQRLVKHPVPHYRYYYHRSENKQQKRGNPAYYYFFHFFHLPFRYIYILP